MKKREILIPAGIIMAVLLLLPGCASRKNIWGDTKKGVILSYRMADGKAYTYQVISDVAQAMEINGQKLAVMMQSYQEYTFSPESSPAGSPISMKVTIDTMHLSIKSPMNEMTPKMDGVIGKSISMTISSTGEESGMEQAKEISYTIGPERRNLGAEFQGFFPNLPDHPVRPGDSWTYNDTVMEESGSNWMGIYGTNTATLEGYETLGSRDCARIGISSTGKVSGKGNTQGVDTETVGEFTGTDKIWFDYKEGAVVKISTAGSAKSQTKTSGIKQMIIPSTREMTKEVTLVDK